MCAVRIALVRVSPGGCKRLARPNDGRTLDLDRLGRGRARGTDWVCSREAVWCVTHSHTPTHMAQYVKPSG
eukprot:2752619-Prymnesium_polylepis.2